MTDTAIELHPGQSEPFEALFMDRSHRVGVVCASRGWGKSYFSAAAALQAVSELCVLPREVPNKNCVIIAPTFSQVQSIYMPLLLDVFHADKFCTKWTKDGGFLFPNNVSLRLMSYEASERLRGTGINFAILDEVTTWEGRPGLQESWQSIIQPCMSTRWSKQVADELNSKYGTNVSPWRALIISTPRGYDTFYDLYNYQDEDENWKSWQFTYHDAPHLDDKEIAQVRKTIDYLQFNREYMASFAESGNNVFYSFDRNEHVRDDLDWFMEGETVHACIDFNVGIQATSVFALRGDQMHFLKEYSGHPDTETLAKTLKRDFAGKKIIAYPDPSGRARKTSAATGVTDFSILKSHGIHTMARSKAPPIVDSVQCVNAHLKNADGDIRMYFSKDCPDTIRSMERTIWKESTDPTIMTIDKQNGDEHHSDGIRYATEFLFPVKATTRKVVRGMAF